MDIRSCAEGVLYGLEGGSFKYGVYDGQTSFIGLSPDKQSLISEKHVKWGGSIKNVLTEHSRNFRDLTIQTFSGDIRDKITGRLIRFDLPVELGGTGLGWVFADGSTGAITPNKEANLPLLQRLNREVEKIEAEHSLESKFLELMKKVGPQIRTKISQANTLISEARELARSSGLPFDNPYDEYGSSGHDFQDLDSSLLRDTMEEYFGTGKSSEFYLVGWVPSQFC